MSNEAQEESLIIESIYSLNVWRQKVYPNGKPKTVWQALLNEPKKPKKG